MSVLRIVPGEMIWKVVFPLCFSIAFRSLSVHNAVVKKGILLWLIGMTVVELFS